MLNRIVFLKIYDRFELVQLRGKIYFTNCTLCSVDQIPNTFMFYVLLLAKKFDGGNGEAARKYQPEGGVVRNSRNNQEHLAVVGRRM